MVLYESHSILHGRPFPLKGRYYANVFIHFEPTGHSLRHDAKVESGDVSIQYKKSVSRRQSGHENDHDGLPSYILEGTSEERKWRAQHPSKDRREKNRGSTEAHSAASKGDLKGIVNVIDMNKDYLDKKDANGWTPIHEAARGGHLEVVKELVHKGADVNVVTGHDDARGKSALYLAVEKHGNDHPLVKFLESIGALMIGPEL